MVNCHGFNVRMNTVGTVESKRKRALVPLSQDANMEEEILELLGRKDYIPMNVPQLLRGLGLPPNRQQELQQVLRLLEQEGRVVRIKGNRYISPREADLIPGKIRMNRAGKGFLQPDDPALKEIVVPETATGTAWHEDRVLVRRDIKPKGLLHRRPEENTGKVIRVLERRRAQIVGTLRRSRQFLYVIPDDPRMSHDIYVPEPHDVGRPARVGDKVVVELREWESRHNNPEGEIIEVLGAPGEEGVDMLSVLRQYDLPLHFPKIVLQEARAIGSQVRPEELAGRTDCRRDQVVTIDPDDAKDFDDAICLQRLSPDQWKLWVHIARLRHINVVRQPRIVRDHVKELPASLQRAHQSRAFAFQDPNHPAGVFLRAAMRQPLRFDLAPHQHAVFVHRCPGRALRNGDLLERRIVRLEKSPAGAIHANLTRDQVSLPRHDVAIAFDPCDAPLLLQRAQHALQLLLPIRRLPQPSQQLRDVERDVIFPPQQFQNLLFHN